MTRIIAGTAKGRPLRVPESGTRPTSDRVKESLFSTLEHRLGGFADVRVLDLYAGSGALGLEAASRGASHVVLVEKSPAAAKVIDANITSTRLSQARSVVADVRIWVASPQSQVPGGWNVVLLDPPYGLSDVDVSQVISRLLEQGALADGCEVVIERAKPRGAGAEFPWPAGLTSERSRAYGDTVVHHAVCYRHESEQAASDGDPGGE
ncbi:MAG: 16S rRNA (guanine(966)-N(2))-methyltransferase RsmD [Actinobacteria bacterium]|nr:16S rRNA (guanine(966)-N(2))-methyltransferase RsmD [Actinomycetota bacterium]